MKTKDPKKWLKNPHKENLVTSTTYLSWLPSKNWFCIALILAIGLGMTWQSTSAQTATLVANASGPFQAYPGAYSANQDLVFTNTGSDSLSIVSVTITGANAADFNIANNFCSNAVLQTGKTCGLEVQFLTTPVTPGNYPATLTVSYADFPNTLTQSVTLNATVLPLPTLSGNPNLSFVPITTTFAGNGTAGYSGSGTAAVNAELRLPQDVQPDQFGNVYIADSGNYVVRKVDINGNITTVAGVPGVNGEDGDGGLATAAHLANPVGVAVDSSGNLYIADYDNANIRRVDATTGIITTVAGSSAYGFGNTGDGGPATSALLYTPYSIIFDSKGNLYILEHSSSDVRKVDTNGIITTYAGISAYADAGYSNNGHSGDGGLATKASLYNPYGLAVDTNDNLYIGDYVNYVVRKVTASTGIISTVAGFGVDGGSAETDLSATSEGVSPLVAEMAPAGVAVDASGNLYISDFDGPVFEATTSGIINWYPSTSTQFSTPAGIRFDSSGALYVSDQYNNRIRKIAAQGVLNFGNQNVGTTSTAQTLTLQNNGSGPLIFNDTPYTVAGDFALSGGGTCSFTATLAVGANCTVDVTFTPQSAGPLTGTISFSGNGTGSPLVAQLSGTGVGTTTPQAVLTPTSIPFGDQTINTTSTAQVVVLSNPGTAPLTGLAVTLAGTNPNSFAETSMCGTTLAVGATCNISLNFTPTAVGAYAANLSVADNAAGTPQTVALTGTGTAAPAPQAVLSPTTLSFPRTTVNTTSTAQTITVSNPGNATLNVTGIAITGTVTSSFSETTTCGASVAAGGSCLISITFSPSSTGNFAAVIALADNATGTPQTAALSGTGVTAAVPQAVLSPTTLSFPNTNVGTTSATQSVTLSNPGTATLNITGISITGASPSDFSETTTCGSTLAASATCSISISFTPTSASSFTGAVSVADNAASSPQAITISGTGATLSTNATFAINASPPTQSVQPGAVAQFNIAITSVSGSFNNAVALAATGLPAGAQASFNPASVTPGSSGATSVMSIQTQSLLALEAPPIDPHRHDPVPLLAALAGFPLLGIRWLRRRLSTPPRLFITLLLAVLSLLPVVALSGCSGGFYGPAPQTYTITVTGTSGSLQQSTTVSLTVQ